MKRIPFFKMSACGNDFCVIDNRMGQFPDPPGEVINKICQRRVSLGADGLIMLERSDQASFKMRFYNSDGSEVEMCGNGARCIARFAYLNKIAPKEMSFDTMAGRIHAVITRKGIKIGLGDVRFSQDDAKVFLKDIPACIEAYHITVGVPHVVCFAEDIDRVDVMELGRTIRYHNTFKPNGTNANFIKVKGSGSLNIRTYERGVEDETLACGTGSTAAAIVASALGLVNPPVKVITMSGCPLWIDFKRHNSIFKQIWIEGEARIICSGDLWMDEISPEYNFE